MQRQCLLNGMELIHLRLAIENFLICQVTCMRAEIVTGASVKKVSPYQPNETLNKCTPFEYTFFILHQIQRFRWL